MATYETLTAKADALLRQGDALAHTDPSESRRILRECRRFRHLAREAQAATRGAPKSAAKAAAKRRS